MAQRSDNKPISPDVVANAPHFSEVKRQIQNIFDKAELVVGYNVSFDIAFIEKEGIIVTGNTFDVMNEFPRFKAGKEGNHVIKKCKLKVCADYFKVSFTPHNSYEDARATLDCFNCMITDPSFSASPKKKRKHKDKPTQKTDDKPVQETDNVDHTPPRFVIWIGPKKISLLKCVDYCFSL